MRQPWTAVPGCKPPWLPFLVDRGLQQHTMAAMTLVLWLYFSPSGRRRHEMRRMRQWWTATVMVVLFLAATAAMAQSPQGMKLYVFSSGALTAPKNFLQDQGPTNTIQLP